MLLSKSYTVRIALLCMGTIGMHSHGDTTSKESLVWTIGAHTASLCAGHVVEQARQNVVNKHLPQYKEDANLSVFTPTPWTYLGGACMSAAINFCAHSLLPRSDVFDTFLFGQLSTVLWGEDQAIHDEAKYQNDKEKEEQYSVPPLPQNVFKAEYNKRRSMWWQAHHAGSAYALAACLASRAAKI